MKNFTGFYESLATDIKKAHESPVSLDEAEKLAAKFLDGQMRVAADLQDIDLDCRMRKSGVKAIKAAVYMEAATKTDKKPSDVMLEAIVNMNEIVASEQKCLDEKEVVRDVLYNYMNIFKEAHIFFRGISKGRFE